MARHFFLPTLVSLAALVGTPVLFPQNNSQGASVSVVVTVEARHGTDIPAIGRDDVMVYQDRDRNRVVDWVPLAGNRGGLELFILIDDAISPTLEAQLDDIRHFMNSQPSTTGIGVAYMQNGVAVVVQNLTTDHALAAKTLRAPLGNPGASASPYFSLEDLVQRWPEGAARREILMLTDGIDRYWGSITADPYVDEIIEKVKRAGIVVCSIYASGFGHYGHTLWQQNWGQLYLSQVSDRTGGEFYFLGAGAPLSFVPHLEDLARRLTHQHLLTFIPKPAKTSGFQKVRFRTEVPNADLVGPDSVWVLAQTTE